MPKLLAVPSPLLRYTASQEKAFADHLEELDSHSVLYPLSSLREVTFDAEGRSLSGGYRLTNWSLFQLCALLSGGLYRCLQDLIGGERKPGADPNDFSLTDAIDFLNKLTKRRFQSRLYGRQVLRDTKTCLIEGVVSGHYRWLPNRQVYLRSKELVSQNGQEVVFYEAWLYGRGLMLRYYNKQAYWATRLPGFTDKFFRGYHFSNNEVGQAALHAAGLLLRERGRTTAITQLASARHSGADFNQTVSEVFADAGKQLLDAKTYGLGVMHMDAAKLGLASKSPEQQFERMQQLAQTLIRRGLPQRLATRIVESAIAQSSFEDEKMPTSSLSSKDWADRSTYDLFNAISRESRKGSIASRERSDQLSYKFLTGQITLNKEP